MNEEKILALHEGRKLCRESIGSVFLFLQIPTIKISSLSWSHQLPSLDPDERASNRSTVSPQVRRMVEGRKEFLDASNVLLLALLLAASDSVGVVKGWSTRQIGAAIGVTPLALKGRLKMLLKKRVLRQVIPGVAAPIFQGKPSTVILLNTNHPLFKSTGRGVTVAINRNIRSDKESILVRMLWLDSKSNRPIEYDREVFLLRSIPLHAFEQLEFMLLEMASQGFEKVLAEQKIDTDALMAQAKADVGRVIRVDDDESERSYMGLELIDKLAFLVYLLVVELDARLKPMLAELREASRVLMLPGNMIQGYGYIGVLVSPAFKACDFAVEGPGAWCGFIRDEADISLGARERAGLDVPVQPFSRH